MAVTFTNAGKVFCYLSSYDNGTNSMGTTDFPRIHLRDGSSWGNYMRLGNYREPSVNDGCKHASSKCIEIKCTGDNSAYISTIYKGSYNFDHSDVSYINPIIMHATKTIMNSGPEGIVVHITKISLETDTFSCNNYGNFLYAGSVKLAEADVDVTLNPGDTATFTITVK